MADGFSRSGKPRRIGENRAHRLDRRADPADAAAANHGPRALVAKRKRLGGAAASRTLDSFPARARSYRPALRGTAMNSFSSFLICLFFACSLAGSRGTENTASRAQSPEPGYHRSIPTKPLPPTLDPEQF